MDLLTPFSWEKDDLKRLFSVRFWFLSALLAIPKPALGRQCPQTSTHKDLVKCHPIRAQRESHVSSCRCRQVCVVVWGKSCSLWKSGGHMSPEVSGLSEGTGQRG